MHEVINLGVSHRAGHILTQFFNCREKQLLDNNDNGCDAKVFLHGTLDGGGQSMSYEPRAVLWDAKNGSGSLGKYQYVSEADYCVDDSKEQELLQSLSQETAGGGDAAGAQVIHTGRRIQRSSYQAALDRNGAVPILERSAAKYWSDYCRMVYGPSSVNELERWYHNAQEPEKAPDYEQLGQRAFESYAVGLEEFRGNCLLRFFEDSLHAQLEQCDSLQGFNVVSEVDNGWGGFSSGMVIELKDELPKVEYFCWGLNEDAEVGGSGTQGRRGRLLEHNRIRATLTMVEESSVYVPLYSVGGLSHWEFGGRVCQAFDSVNMVAGHGVSLAYLVDVLTLADVQRNVVDLVRTDGGREDGFWGRVPRRKAGGRERMGSEVFSQVRIMRSRCGAGAGAGEDADARRRKVLWTDRWAPSDTIPEDYRQLRHVDLGITEKSRDVFLNWQDVVTRQFRYDSDREELKEKLGTLASVYESGWYDDGDEGDDC
ncbi:Dml1p Ecym_6230 [Eremothecium cymbalariae DBVPG|uniref:Protein DML1 n=1 Tax=Eremothecium cymbalariae (strain CBS 270.75 / DBVPG 7215 / KCTC 17166 / NRRL Y-17582) TaxID=931890 RepID=G8JVD3_ERECY|nr:hypothetical protein Ecym_6230 [Eremothecium cymbalariae DBVPG\